MVSVSPEGGDIWAGGREGDAGPRCGWWSGRRAPDRPPGSPGSWVLAESGKLAAGGCRASSPGHRGREDPPGSASSRRHPGGRLSPGGAGAGPAARPSRQSAGRVPAAVDTHLAWPEKPTVSALGFWEPVLLLCHFVPAPPFIAARRPVLPTPLLYGLVSVCVRFPREAHQLNVIMSPRCTGKGRGPGLGLAKQR